jgi:hypothetical protein
MNMKKSYVRSYGVLMILIAVIMLAPGLVFAETCQLIRITEETGAGDTRIIINPEKITVPLRTCVVWINWVEMHGVSVSFRENAKQCVFATDASTGFEMKAGESCYLTEHFPMGKTASMYFHKPGVFKYTLELEGKPNVTAEGVIEIK